MLLVFSLYTYIYLHNIRCRELICKVKSGFYLCGDALTRFVSSQSNKIILEYIKLREILAANENYEKAIMIMLR